MSLYMDERGRDEQCSTQAPSKERCNYKGAQVQKSKSMFENVSQMGRALIVEVHCLGSILRSERG